jgi:hypothetical protein
VWGWFDGVRGLGVGSHGSAGKDCVPGPNT